MPHSSCPCTAAEEAVDLALMLLAAGASAASIFVPCSEPDDFRRSVFLVGARIKVQGPSKHGDGSDYPR